MFLIFITFTQSLAMYVLNTKGIQIRSGKFHYINISQIASHDKQQINHTGVVQIEKILFDSSLFDVFLLNQSGFSCYLERYYNSSWEQPCYFLSNKSQSFLLQTSFNTTYNIDLTGIQFIIIDNTHFPQGGAFYNDDLHIQSQFTQYIQPIPTYYNYTIKIIIVFLGFLICFFIWCIVLTMKYKKEKAHQNKIEKIKLIDNLETPQKHKRYKLF